MIASFLSLVCLLLVAARSAVTDASTGQTEAVVRRAQSLLGSESESVISLLEVWCQAAQVAPHEEQLLSQLESTIKTSPCLLDFAAEFTKVDYDSSSNAKNDLFLIIMSSYNDILDLVMRGNFIKPGHAYAAQADALIKQRLDWTAQDDLHKAIVRQGLQMIKQAAEYRYSFLNSDFLHYHLSNFEDNEHDLRAVLDYYEYLNASIVGEDDEDDGGNDNDNEDDDDDDDDEDDNKVHENGNTKNKAIPSNVIKCQQCLAQIIRVLGMVEVKWDSASVRVSDLSDKHLGEDGSKHHFKPNASLKAALQQYLVEHGSSAELLSAAVSIYERGHVMGDVTVWLVARALKFLLQVPKTITLELDLVVAREIYAQVKKILLSLHDPSLKDPLVKIVDGLKAQLGGAKVVAGEQSIPFDLGAFMSTKMSDHELIVNSLPGLHSGLLELGSEGPLSDSQLANIDVLLTFLDHKVGLVTTLYVKQHVWPVFATQVQKSVAALASTYAVDGQFTFKSFFQARSALKDYPCFVGPSEASGKTTKYMICFSETAADLLSEPLRSRPMLQRLLHRAIYAWSVEHRFEYAADGDMAAAVDACDEAMVLPFVIKDRLDFLLAVERVDAGREKIARLKEGPVKRLLLSIFETIKDKPFTEVSFRALPDALPEKRACVWKEKQDGLVQLLGLPPSEGQDSAVSEATLLATLPPKDKDAQYAVVLYCALASLAETEKISLADPRLLFSVSEFAPTHKLLAPFLSDVARYLREIQGKWIKGLLQGVRHPQKVVPVLARLRDLTKDQDAWKIKQLILQCYESFCTKLLAFILTHMAFAWKRTMYVSINRPLTKTAMDLAVSNTGAMPMVTVARKLSMALMVYEQLQSALVDPQWCSISTDIISNVEKVVRLNPNYYMYNVQPALTKYARSLPKHPFGPLASTATFEELEERLHFAGQLFEAFEAIKI